MDRGVLGLVAGIIVSCMLAFYIGILKEKQDNALNLILMELNNPTRKEIVKRAKTLNKSCYTNDDLEFIIFGESQL